MQAAASLAKPYDHIADLLGRGEPSRWRAARNVSVRVARRLAVRDVEIGALRTPG
jgi:hypothetical protein